MNDRGVIDNKFMASSKQRRFQVGCELNYSSVNNTTFIFNICAVSQNSQTIIEENIQTEPFRNFEEYIAPVVKNRYLRVSVPKGNFKLSYRSTVELCCIEENVNSISETIPAKLPLDTFYYLYPSRYCQSDLLVDMAQEEFGHLINNHSKVTAVCNWIYKNVSYVAGSTNAQTSACDTAANKTGVCRDFAHLAITFCRALNIPARFVSVYAYKLNPPDFHACFEAYLGNSWYLFDPTRMADPDGLIRIGTGRDAADVSFATIFGPAQLEEMNIFVTSSNDKSVTETTQAIAF
jgi:transglutaminase-like putative cysteine protease